MGPCPHCPSSDGYKLHQHADGRINSFCYVCETGEYRVSDETLNNLIGQEPPVGPVESSYKPRDFAWVMENSTIPKDPIRGIPVDILMEGGVRVGFSEETGEIDRHYYPYTRPDGEVSFKERIITPEKDFRIIGSGKRMPLYMQDHVGAGGKLLIVTEGELDCLAAKAMLRARGKNYRVVSLPAGANARSVRDNIEWLDSFENIFLALDQDEPGQAASKEISEVLTPGKCKIMHFSEKDPCDMWLANKAAEFFNSVYSAQEIRPDGIVTVDDLYEKAITPVKWGLSYPWETLTKVTYGYRRGELIGIGAGSGTGKTEAFKEMIDHLIRVHELPVGVLFLEEAADKTLKVLAGKKWNKRFHVPDGDWHIDELIAGIDDLRGKVYMYDHFGSKDWETIKKKIRYMALSIGIKDFFLDHLTAMVAQEADEYKALNRIMEELASLTQELDITIFYISHLRKAQGVPHEEGGRVSADQFKGSGAIVFWSNFLFGLERNQQGDTASERNTTTLRVLKDRNTGLATGMTIKLWYDHDTGRWREKLPDDGMEETLDPESDSLI